ncbi:predicted protein [Botrytis cinerea T4]|uniref:Uncharacterized protein n=1 Tax=Botryotinia fuckeliana (strain T4) TaxID=999810 RepID=G2YBS4_BOTF4|nr:predicted protein [Botrytis cinerea T4]
MLHFPLVIKSREFRSFPRRTTYNNLFQVIKGGGDLWKDSAKMKAQSTS